MTTDQNHMHNKDEFRVEEPELVISPWWPSDPSESDHIPEDSAQKCGEVFRTKNGNFTFVCIECNCNFIELALFGEHLLNRICELKEEFLSDESGQRILVPDDISYADDMIDVEVEDSNDEVSNFESDETVAIENIVVLTQTQEVSTACKDTGNEDKKADTDEVCKNEKEFKTNVNSSFEDNFQSEASIQFDEDFSNDEDCLEKVSKQPKKRRVKDKKLDPNEIPFCAACSRAYKTGVNFRKHLLQKHKDVFSTEDLKNKSIQNLEETIVKNLKEMMCIYCYKYFDSIKEFREHAPEHVGASVFICKFCPKSFGSQYNRQLHMNTHEDIRPYKCSYCPKAFSSPANLQNHERLHLNITRYACSFCDKRFIKGSDRKIHERIHTKERPFQCEECGQRFITPILLKDHKLRHDGTKNFKCSECGKSFYTGSLLKYHKQSHSVEPEFECKICGQKFRRLKSLHQHKGLHAEVKKYNCKVCGKAFAQFAGLYSHMKSHGEVVK